MAKTFFIRIGINAGIVDEQVIPILERSPFKRE
jgi:hypothetical protein